MLVLLLRGLHFHIDGFFGELENWMLLSIFLVMADAEVEENCTQWPNRSLPSKALQMHLSELNSYELRMQVRDNSAVTEAGNEDELKRGLGTGLAEWYTGVDALKRTHKNDCTRKRKGGKAHTTHTHTYPLNANAIKGRITVKSIRTNLREMKWSKRKMEGKKQWNELKKRVGRLRFTQAQGLLLSTLWTINGPQWQLAGTEQI